MKIAFFSIPAHGHTNPMLPVAAELVSRGDTVRFYSFEEFGERIKATGAEFVSCDRFLPEVSDAEMEKLMNVSNTEMTIQDIRTTLLMNDFLDSEFKSFKPDVVYTDAVCFWGKLNAWKHNVPMVCSTSTFAFNRMSSKYMKYSSAEIKDMLLGLPKISKELKTLRPYGYNVKRALDLVQNDNKTDTVVYTSREFQPYSESFTDHYAFVGPSVFSKADVNKAKDRPLVYISLGTVINDRPDFYNNCIEALSDENVDVIISRGVYMDEKRLNKLPDNIKTFERVDQLDVLSRADVFITHCGMNSVSESLYMAAPMALYPQTNEQRAVAKRVEEKGAGITLCDDSPEGIKKTVTEILNNKKYADSAKHMSDNFRSCIGVKGAADFIKSAPHTSDGIDLIEEMNKTNRIVQPLYWLVILTLIVLFGIFVSWLYVWIIGVAGGILFYPICNKFQMMRYNLLAKKVRNKNEKAV